MSADVVTSTKLFVMRYNIAACHRFDVFLCGQVPVLNNQTIVNILFMAPRMVYLSMIYLLWSIICRNEYNVSTRHLRALITYWCHVCCLRFRRDNLIVDGRQMVSLISVDGRGSLSDVYGLLHFSLVPVACFCTISICKKCCLMTKCVS